MTLKELENSLIQRRKGQAYQLWKNAYLIGESVKDLFSKTGQKRIFPASPEDASPELYPPKPSIEKPKFLYGKKYTLKGGMMYSE